METKPKINIIDIIDFPVIKQERDENVQPQYKKLLVQQKQVKIERDSELDYVSTEIELEPKFQILSHKVVKCEFIKPVKVKTESKKSTEEKVDRKNQNKLKIKKQRVYPCNYCNKPFFRRNSKYEHMKHACPKNKNKTKHPTAECDLCKRVFSTKGSRDQHRKYTCPFINKITDNSETNEQSNEKQGTLVFQIETQNNLIILSGAKYQCDSCGKQYKKKYNLQKHIKLKHKDKKTCKYCNKVLACRSSRDKHEKNNCPMNMEKLRLDHGCPLCKKIFANKHHIQRHIKYSCPKNKNKIIAKPTPAICKYCQKEFYAAGARNRHMKQSCSMNPDKQVLSS